MPYTATCPPPDMDVSIYGRWTNDTVLGIWESYNKINFVNACHVIIATGAMSTYVTMHCNRKTSLDTFSSGNLTTKFTPNIAIAVATYLQCTGVASAPRILHWPSQCAGPDIMLTFPTRKNSGNNN